VSVVVFTVHPRRLAVSRRRLRRRHRSGVFHAILASVQPLPAALVVSSPAPVVVVVVLSSFPVVVAFVPPSSRSRPPPAFRQVCSSPVIVFVLASASSSLVPAVSRLHPRIAAEVVPSPSAVPVRRCRSHAS
jgi:1,4-dihydroxy-2-naphthoate octaprenyltransferase